VFFVLTFAEEPTTKQAQGILCAVDDVIDNKGKSIFKNYYFFKLKNEFLKK